VQGLQQDSAFDQFWVTGWFDAERGEGGEGVGEGEVRACSWREGVCGC
jgi:hypothetical protein